MHNQGQAVIKKLLLVPSRTDYKNVYQRSYNLNVTGDDINMITAVFSKDGVDRNNKLLDTTVASSLSGVMKISDSTTGVVGIQNGWQTQRLRFLMEVEIMVGNSLEVSYIQGYTEYHDPSLSGLIDPNMKFHINSIINISKMVDPVSNQIIVRPRNTFNVITNLAGQNVYESNNPHDTGLKLIRPNDIIEDIGMNDMYADDHVEVINKLGAIGNEANTSRRSNNDAIKYLTTTINSVITAKNLADVSYDTSDVLRTASSQTVEESLISNPFVYMLHTLKRIPSPTSFTMGDLVTIDPSVGGKTHQAQGDNGVGYRETIMDTSDTADMLNPTIENKIATTVAHSISGMMADNMLTKLSINFTNMSGQIMVTPTNFESFIDGVDCIGYVNKIIDKITHITMPDITQNNLVVVSVNVMADLLGDTTVNISYGAGPQTVFRFPVFTDSLYAPVITDEYGRAGMSESMTNLIDLTWESAGASL